MKRNKKRREPSERDGEGSSKVRFVLEAFVFGVHGFALIARYPAIIRQLIGAFRRGGAGVANAEFAAFGPIDLGFRSWYQKIAHDYEVRGRFGFAWDDGLGMPLGPRIYNNLVTYWVLGRLGSRSMMSLGYGLLLMSTAVVLALLMGPWAMLVVPALAVSPVLVAGYTHRGKPESFWWFGALAGLAAGYAGYGLPAGLIWSALAFVNLPVAIMSALVGGPALVIRSWGSGSLGWLILGVTPGAIKVLVRLHYMKRQGFLSSLVSEQARLWKRGFRPTRSEVAILAPFAVGVLTPALQGDNILASALLAASGAGLYWMNYRLYYLNDPQSHWLAMWTSGMAFSAALGSWAGVLMMCVFAFTAPVFLGIVVKSRLPQSSDPWRRRAATARLQFRRYPALQPLSRVRPPRVMEFFESIPDNQRVLAETAGDPRSGSILRPFWTWTEEFLPERGVDLGNEMYTRIVEPDLMDNYLSRFNGFELAGDRMRRLADGLGASHVLAYQTKTVDSLCSNGFFELARVDLAPLKEFRTLLKVPPIELVLLARNRPSAVIAPVTPFEIARSTFTWWGRQGSTYIIRYRYHRHFVALQGAKYLEVEPISVFSELNLNFMSVTVPEEGRVRLIYRPPLL